ncbi:MAG: hypothetical protein M3408_12800 [Actinomycetota bacterium]|nr:hypothetical protein [Actinomycetota bacterium]
MLIDPGSEPADLSPPVTQSANGTPVISRAGWGADESLRCSDPDYDDRVKVVTLHHTPGDNRYGPRTRPALCGESTPTCAETMLISRGGGTSRYPRGTAVHLPVHFGHRDVGATGCPGDDGYVLLAGLRSAAASTPA